MAGADKSIDNKDPILWENEVNANKLLIAASFITVLIFLIPWSLSKVGIFYVYGLGQSSLGIFLILAIPCIAAAIGIKFKCERRWIKYMLMVSLMIVYAMADAIYTYNVPLLMIIPIVLSSRYFSKKYTIITSICTFIMFFISTIIGVYYGALDMNSLELSQGTVISLGEETWLSDVVELGYVDFDMDLMLFNVLFYGYMIKSMQALIVAVICVIMAEHGKKLILKQKTMTEHATRVNTELDLARNIQADMLPSTFPAFPERDEFDIYASMDPAKEVGGDFYDLFLVDEDHLCFMIADVSGKGIPAAMFMMASKNILSNHAKLGMSPAKVIDAANKVVCENNNEDMFVTVWLGVLQISTGILTASNAGHEYPVIKRNGKEYEILKDVHKSPVGFFEEMEYDDYEIKLNAGDKLFLYTDGVPEATNSELEMFGMERTVAALNSIPDADPKQMLEKIRESVDAFVGGAEQFDDLTMLAIEYRGSKA